MLLKVRNIFTQYIIASIILFLPVIPLLPQNYTAKTFTTKDGLPNNKIMAIAEDSTGFLWIGTWDGLSRYDGYNFKNYYHIPGDTYSIPYFSIRNLLVDKNNNLWVLTDRSEIVLYDRIHDNFKRIIESKENEQSQIIAIDVDNNGNLWIIYKNKILKRDLKSGNFSSFEIINENGESFLWENSSYYVADFSDPAKIWLIGPKVYEMGIKDSDSSTGKIIIRNVYNLEIPDKQKRVDYEHYWSISFYKSPTGNYWIFSNFGIFKLDKEKLTFRDYKGTINDDEFVGSTQFLWTGDEGNIYSYDQKTHTTRFYKPESRQLILAIHQQGKNLIWFSGTSESGTPLGLSQIFITNSFFKNYSIKEGNELPAVFSIVKDQHNVLWVGIKGKDYIVQFTPDNKIKKTGQLTSELFRSGGHIRSMIRVNDGIWIGYYGDLLFFYDFKSGQFVRHFAEEKSFRTLAVSKVGDVFIGNENLSLYHPESGKTEKLWTSSNNHIIYKLFLDESGILWAGKNMSMLLKYNTITKESTIFSIPRENYHIEDICPGDNNDLWLATLGEGLCNFNPGSGKTTYFTTTSGLSSNTTYCILKDKSGNLWVSTGNGISRLDPKNGNIRIFNNTDGLEIKEFNSDASYISDDGEFFFGGMGGFVGFYPDSLSETDKDIIRPRLLLTDFTVSGEKKIIAKSLNNSDTITLFKGENNFQLSFSSTDFNNSDIKLFRYRLEKINKSWIETDSHNRNANYSNLKPGKYLFEIQATSSNGDWTASKKIVFLIKPYFYQTRLFLISVPLILVLILTGIIITYIRQLKQREKQKQDALKLQSLRGQMNPHFIFNSLNSLNYFISNNDKLASNRYIADFSRLIRSILSNLGNDYVPLENEVTSIRDYLNIEHLRFGDKFDFELKIDDLCKKSNLLVFPGLVQPFIENAIWHGMRAIEKRKGLIKVNLSVMGITSIKCIVEDDGIGRKASMQRRNGQENHKSMGINIVEERLHLVSKLQGIKYNLKISDLYPDRKDKGTIVEIDIPAKPMKQE